MTPTSSSAGLDHQFMEIALSEAHAARDSGNCPVGAVLVIDGKIVGRGHNHTVTSADRISHAEALIFLKHSSEIRKYKFDPTVERTLYTTLEPCLMCFGMAVIHRVTRIVYACEDPRGDVGRIDPKQVGDWYVTNWPGLDKGPFAIESRQLMRDFYSQRTDPEGVATNNLYEESAV